MKTPNATLRKRNKKSALFAKRKVRVRKRLAMKGEGIRLSVFRSAKHISIQAIDEATSSTLMSASTYEKSLQTLIEGKKKKEAAFLVGEVLGNKLKELNAKKVVFDRNGFRFAGRVAEVARGIREAGIGF